MPDPKEEQRRSTQFDPQREEKANKTVNKAVSSKRETDERHLSEKENGHRRAGDPRSGSDSNRGRRTRWH